MKNPLLLALFTGATISLSGHASAQSVYSADWSTLSGADGSYTVSMTLESGPALGGISSYSLSIENDNGRTFFNNTTSALTSGPYTADVAQETNTFSVSAGTFAGIASIQRSDVVDFTNLTDVKGQLLNPTGSSASSFPIDLGETDSTSMVWNSQNFGFDTLRLDPDAPSGGTNIWDEYTFHATQTWETVPEPSSLMLISLAGISLLGRRRR